ncbi:MAG TPA: hypothetical protein VMG40_12920 [Bryobacteraceae bacterium]|jgi:hypothetical protein|nr:hypothetical protein [Bryobacteraceae bacterium]
MAQTSEYITRAELREELEALEQRLNSRFEGRMDAQEQRLKDFVRDFVTEANHNMETRLLQAFYGFAESANSHFKQLDMNYAGVLARVTTLETRMLECEKRLNIPPSI